MGSDATPIAVRTRANARGFLWTGTANGVTVLMFTTNGALHLRAEPILTDHVIGVALIDEQNRPVANHLVARAAL